MPTPNMPIEKMINPIILFMFNSVPVSNINHNITPVVNPLKTIENNNDCLMLWCLSSSLSIFTTSVRYLYQEISLFPHW